jgi:CRP-like cAMP-binding protein
VPPAADIVALTEGLPDRRLATGEVLFEQDDRTDRTVAVLVEGVLTAELDGAVIDEHTVPGVFVGEVGALLGAPRTATVRATTPATVRIIGDPETFFASHPELALELARQLAGRLQRLVSYVADVRHQYADAEGHLGLVHDVLESLASRPPVEIEPGSDRSPDY